MEKKKLLLVAVSVGVVLLIIIGIPLMMIAPRQSQGLALQPTANDMDRNWGVAVEPARVQPQPEAVVEPPVPAFNAQPVEPVFDPQSETAPAEVPHVTTITVPVPQAPAVPDVPVIQVKRTAPVTLAQDKPAAPKPAVSASTTPKETAKPTAAKSKDSASSAATPAAKTSNTYWVQTGAFSTKVRAEGAKELLAAKGIASIIDNRDIDGKTWYRVRVGPYTTETEANYWLALVKSIDGFAESQIRLSQATR